MADQQDRNRNLTVTAVRTPSPTEPLQSFLIRQSELQCIATAPATGQESKAIISPKKCDRPAVTTPGGTKLDFGKEFVQQPQSGDSWCFPSSTATTATQTVERPTTMNQREAGGGFPVFQQPGGLLSPTAGKVESPKKNTSFGQQVDEKNVDAQKTSFGDDGKDVVARMKRAAASAVNELKRI